MGKASRHKKDRKAGLNNPIARKAVAIASRGAVINELKNATTEEQIKVLSSISPSKVGKAIMREALGEMDKGIRNLLSSGREVTVDELLKEARNTPGFLQMCENAGVLYSWFEQLACDRMKKQGLVVK